MAKILVVDDGKVILELSRAILSRAGHEVLVTSEPDRVVSMVDREALTHGSRPAPF